MKQILAALLLLFPCLCFGKKDPPLPDSFVVVPAQSACIAFETNYVGELQKRDSTSWTFKTTGVRKAESFGIQFKAAVRHDKTLFEDCVLFEPVRQACVAKRDQVFLGTHFFIHPAGNDIPESGGVVPASVRFYTDTSGVQPMFTGYLSSDKFPAEKIPDYLRPFYFRKYEVTNAEYREFTEWVKDSIIRTRLGYLLPNGMLNRKREYDYRSAIITYELRLPENERHWNLMELDPRKINYRFASRPEGFAQDTVNVHPDTTSWTQDFLFSFNEPMEGMYNWHPAYDDYPVAGVTYWQCLAFLEWKSRQLQSVADKKKLNCKVKCCLPSELEWDYVSTADIEKDALTLAGHYSISTCDDSWLTDLRLMRYSDNDQIVYAASQEPEDTARYVLAPPRKRPVYVSVFADDFDKPLRRMDLDDEKMWGDFIYDGYFHTGPAKLNADGSSGHNKTLNERSAAHYDRATGVCWMDGNVSEWIREDVSQWRGIFSKHMLPVNGPYAAEQKVIRDYEKYYFDQLPAKGKLVRGANWYDERFAMKYGKNKGGLQAKTFCNPDSAHCTVGFRYVIYLEEK